MCEYIKNTASFCTDLFLISVLFPYYFVDNTVGDTAHILTQPTRCDKTKDDIKLFIEDKYLGSIPSRKRNPLVVTLVSSIEFTNILFYFFQFFKILVFLRLTECHTLAGCLHVKFHSEMKFVPG